MTLKVIVTVPPYADFIEAVVSHPMVHGLRLNTVMPIKESPCEILQKITAYGKPLWVDLKSRQLRVVGAAIPPFTTLTISHPIRVNLPADIYFSDGSSKARIMAVDGNQLILDDGPQRLVGPGESINIPDPSLIVDGLLTGTDLAYLQAMQTLGLTKVMLSYVEDPADLQAVKNHLPQAEILAKIESNKGLAFVRKFKTQFGHLMAARGDLFLEVERPHRIIEALQTVIYADPLAFVASRLFDSLVSSPTPSSADISDAALLIKLGYRNFMFGDEICLHRETILAGLNLLQAIAGQIL